jgi:hypothetical protein
MNETIEIDQDFGVPGKSKYDFAKLRVGGALKTNDLSKYQQLRSAATRQGKKLKRKFSVRKIKEADEATGNPVSKIAVVRTK